MLRHPRGVPQCPHEYKAAGGSYASYHASKSQGFSLIEVLVVTGILAIVGTLIFMSTRGPLVEQQERAAIRSIQQSVWQGATAASARGRNTELLQLGQRFIVREVDSGRVIRTDDLPQGITTSLPNLVFTPPGKISEASFEAVADGITVQSTKGVTHLRVSIIGEVVADRE